WNRATRPLPGCLEKAPRTLRPGVAQGENRMLAAKSQGAQPLGCRIPATPSDNQTADDLSPMRSLASLKAALLLRRWLVLSSFDRANHHGFNAELAFYLQLNG